MRWLPLSLAFFLLLLVGINARADYLPIPLTELFGGSELIVLGTIESVGDDSFILQEDEVYAGSIEDTPLEVAKYRDWTGGRRWSEYRAGQTVLLFLRKPTADEEGVGEYWRIRGRGGEGEMPIEDGAIYPHGLNLEGFRRQTFNVQGGELYGYRFDLGTFMSALTGFLRCFGPSRQAAAEDGKVATRECDDSELASYRATSALHRYLVSSRSGDTK